MSLRKLILAGVLGLTMTSTASATDLYSVVTSAPQGSAASFNWDGFYIGKFVMLSSEDLSSNYFAWGGTLGYNWESDGIVYGIEKSIGLVEGSDLFIEGQFRVGTLAGETDGVLLYGAAGAGWVNSTFYALPGVGIEFMLTDQISLDAGTDLALYAGGGFSVHAKAGLNFHLQ